MHAAIPKRTKTEVQLLYLKRKLLVNVMRKIVIFGKKKEFHGVFEKRVVNTQSILMKQKYITAKKNALKDIYLNFEISYAK